MPRKREAPEPIRRLHKLLSERFAAHVGELGYYADTATTVTFMSGWKEFPEWGEGKRLFCGSVTPLDGSTIEPVTVYRVELREEGPGYSETTVAPWMGRMAEWEMLIVVEEWLTGDSYLKRIGHRLGRNQQKED